MTSRGLNSWVPFRRIYTLPDVPGPDCMGCSIPCMCPRKSYGEQNHLALRLVVRQLGDATAENKQNSLSAIWLCKITFPMPWKKNDPSVDNSLR